MAVLFVAAIIAGVAGAATWTDQPDYSPGSTVTISGDNSNLAGYLAGETVHVDVTGPYGWTATCDGVASDDGAWSCQVTLADGPDAVGEYTYTATGLDSGVSENGSFTDGSFFLRAMVGATPLAVGFASNTIQRFGANATCAGTPTQSNSSTITTSTTNAFPTLNFFTNLTGFPTVTGSSMKLTAPATVTSGGNTYAFSSWTAPSNAPTITPSGTAACFSGWNASNPTQVQANYVLAQGTLQVKKEFANDTGKTGNKTAADFSFTVNGGTSQAFEADAQNDLTVDAGNYSVVEDAENGYTASYSNSANGNADCTSLAVAASGTTTCTITNTFNGYATSTATQVASTSFTIGGTVGDTATVTGDADAGADPSGNVDFYLCGPTDPDDPYVACDTGGTKVKDNATLVSDGNAGTYTASVSYTVTAAQLNKAGKYCMRAEYEDDSLYKDSKDDGSTNECFTVEPASAIVTYTGAFDSVEGTPTALTATVQSSYKGCASPRVVTFDLTGITYNANATATTGTASGTGPYTGTASTTKVLLPDAYDVLASVDEVDLVGSDGFPECLAADDEGILDVAPAGSDAQGGGWYKAPDATPPRVNFGFAVKKQRDLSYKGQILWMNNDSWKLKGSLTGYGVIACPTGTGVKCGVVTGTGTLYEWFSKTETWANPRTVTFTAKFYDGGQTSCSKKTCTKQERPDWFGMEINALTIEPESDPQQLMGGSIHAGT